MQQHDPAFSTIVVDDFFEQPDRIRSWALGMTFYAVENYNRRFRVAESWPGKRTQCLHELSPAFVQEFADQILTLVMHLPPCEFLANISFQLTTVDDGDSWIHRDDGRYQVAGLVYLTPDAPTDAGTLFYEQRNERFQVIDRIGNRYGRLLLFDSQILHKSGRYFGSTLDDGRLTLPFFLSYQPDFRASEAA